MKFLLASLSIFAATAAMAEPSERAIKLSKEYIIVDGHIDAPTTIAEKGANIATGEKRSISIMSAP